MVNARIDAMIRGGDVEEGLARAAAYRDAGADCVYPIGVTDESEIARFVALEVPVNILLAPGAPPVSRLRELGVARVSLGEYVYADAMDFVRERLFALGGRRARGRGQLAELLSQRRGDGVEVRDRVVVGDQPEVDLPVVGHDRHAERAVLGQRHLRVDAAQPAAEQVQGELRAGDVRHGEVEEPLHGLQPRGLGEDRRRREVGELGEHLRPDGLAGLLQAAHRLVDGAEARDRVVEVDRERRVDRRHLVAQGSALGVRADGDGHHRAQALGGRPGVRQVVGAQGAGHGREHDVVDRAAERVLDRLEGRELGVDPGEAPMRADPAVERRAGGTVEPCAGDRGEADRRGRARPKRPVGPRSARRPRRGRAPAG